MPRNPVYCNRGGGFGRVDHFSDEPGKFGVGVGAPIKGECAEGYVAVSKNADGCSVRGVLTEGVGNDVAYRSELSKVVGPFTERYLEVRFRRVKRRWDVDTAAALGTRVSNVCTAICISDNVRRPGGRNGSNPLLLSWLLVVALWCVCRNCRVC